MGYWPVALDVTRRPVVVVGSGEAADVRVEDLLAVEARVVVVTADPTPRMQAWADAGRIVLHRRFAVPEDLRGASLVLALGHDRAANRQVARWARSLGVVVNCHDDPQYCDCLAMAKIRRGGLTVAVSTGGRSPALARYVRERLEGCLDPVWTELVERAKKLRTEVLGTWTFRDWASWIEGELAAAPRSLTADAAAGEGRVFLVGAGPGDPELVTVKAARILAKAQVVVHDRLVHPGVLALSPPSAERIPVGKGRGAAVPQEAIHRILVDRARRGLRVVRLKGGDPFLLGRGAEEVLALASAGIPWEVVPGISSALAAPLAAGIPLTHRGVAATAVIASGRVADPRGVDWAGLARVDGTLVLLMGMDELPVATRRLVAAGKDPLAPSAAIQWATWEQERVVRAPLADLAAACRRAGVGSPGVVVVGPVVDVLRQVLPAREAGGPSLPQPPDPARYGRETLAAPASRTV